MCVFFIHIYHKCIKCKRTKTKHHSANECVLAMLKWARESNKKNVCALTLSLIFVYELNGGSSSNGKKQQRQQENFFAMCVHIQKIINYFAQIYILFSMCLSERMHECVM